MFITLLIIVVVSLISTNANTGVSLCNKPNEYSWKVYEIVVSKSSIRQGVTCADEFTENGYNIQYCYSNSILTMNMILKGLSELFIATLIQIIIINNRKC